MSYDSYVNAAIIEMQLRGYSPKTIDSYSKYLRRFLLFTDKPVDALSTEDVRSFLLFLVSRKLSTSYINSTYSICQLFFKSVLKKPFSLDDIPRVKSSKKLPMVLSSSEVIAILNATSNLKHKAILMVAYSAGLRVSEVVHLKVSDIDSANMQIFVRSGKGDMDRYTILSRNTLEYLRLYFKSYRPNDWLFFSASDRSQPLSPRTAQKCFKSSTLKAGVLKPVTIHTLRHSFATHLLINGTNLFTIKTLLGHKSIQSTMVYLHLAPTRILSVVSPLDLKVQDFE
jgi:site-specific recombinase XerD